MSDEMGNTGCVGLILYSGSRDDLQRKLRARDDRITVLEEALRDICDRCETWPNPGDSEALLRAKALLD